MLTPVLEKLLVLQDRHAKQLALDTQLKAVPREIEAVNQRIAAEKTAIEAAKAELRELEVKKKSLENEISAAEGQVVKYKNQQMEVRKNDEYQALTHQIDGAQAQIGALEEAEIAVMLAIDEAKAKFAAAEGVLRQNIAGHEARIKMFQERAVSLQAELLAMAAEVEAARAPVEAGTLRHYDRLAKSLRLPVVVPVSDQRCGGCHLKISSGIESEARKGDKITACDQCGRMVYWAS